MTEPREMVNVFALLLTGALLIALHGLLMAPDLWRLEWSFEWLYTLPLSVPALLIVRTVASTLANLAGFFFLGPLLGTIAYGAGWGGWALPLALTLSAPLLIVVSLMRQMLEVTMRLRLEPARLRNLQAAFTAAGLVLYIPMMFMFSPASQNPDSVVYASLKQLPDWIRFTPPGFAACALTTTSAPAAAGYVAALFGSCGLITALGLAFLDRRLARGLIVGGGRESSRSKGALPPATRRRLFTPFQGKTLTLLARDRNMLVTVFGLPAFVIAQQYLMFGDLTLISTPARACAVAFSVGAMALAMALPQVVMKEAETLWFLKTFPRSIESMLLESAALWGTLLTLYPIAALVLSMRQLTAPAGVWAVYFCLVIFGMAAYTIIATGLALLSSNPTATDTRKQLSPWGMWLYMVLAGVYIQALVSDDPWRILGGFTLAVMLAYAFWQKVGDHLPYMLDPAAEPPPQVSLSDGLIAAEMFFLLQAVALAGMHVASPSLRELLPSFAIAGGMTCVLAVVAAWQLKISGMPRVVGPGGIRAAGEGLIGGALTGAIGLAWIYAIHHVPRFAGLAPAESPVRADEGYLLAALGICAAPVFEELIFRGLVYTGLRRSMPRASAIIAGALLFAVLHPAHAFVPVLSMALAACVLFERHKLLLAPILVHAVYNACVLFVRVP